MRAEMRLTRREAMTTAMGSAMLAADAAPRRNVLFICADDLNSSLSVFGNRVVRTPNVERLARRGVSFDRASCQYPLCQPSRTSFLSGKRPETTRVWTLETPTRETLGDTVMLPELFRRNGYFTAHAGKIFHTGIGEDPRSWDEEIREYGKSPARAEILKSADNWSVLKTRDEDTPDGRMARKTAEWLEARKRDGKLFFIGTGFRRPHSPYAAPKKYFDMYPAERIELLPAADAGPVLPAAANGSERVGAAETRARIAAYYASISFMDAQFGVVLDAMDRLALWESTAVVFFGDHGYLLGEHGGMWHKNSLYEASARVPLIVAAPGIRGAGQHSPRLVELVDLYPALCDVCGVRPPMGLEGTSFRPLLDTPERAWKRAAFTMQGRGKDRAEAAKDVAYAGKSVRTERWRYTEWDEGKRGVELYDEEADPKELVNMAGDGKHAAVEAELRELLRQGYRAK